MSPIDDPAFASGGKVKDKIKQKLDASTVNDLTADSLVFLSCSFSTQRHKNLKNACRRSFVICLLAHHWILYNAKPRHD